MGDPLGSQGVTTGSEPQNAMTWSSQLIIAQGIEALRFYHYVEPYSKVHTNNLLAQPIRLSTLRGGTFFHNTSMLGYLNPSSAYGPRYNYLSIVTPDQSINECNALMPIYVLHKIKPYLPRHSRQQLALLLGLRIYDHSALVTNPSIAVTSVHVSRILP